ncbi:MAG: hypothetical protein SCARUB_04974 [Candidatus Scalindua rubra]|uniref:Uncharacterized protein n=1 Tax=Candidatus Scalindua rubra TaxID=1872076 RepID=A0A1E3X2Y8_9BACT|nr:MAG: hypothetical protein SCARUB_04974 [Candidatus Scalindua rubra]
MQSSSKKETIDCFENAIKNLNNVRTLYTENFVNWKGVTKDSKEYYTEIIAEELINKINNENIISENIKPLERENYKVPSRGKTFISNTNRKEENVAKRIDKMECGELGHILYYQMPLKPNNKIKKVGKIDLVSFKKDENIVYVIELKVANKNETLLRAILEIITYYQQLNQTNFINSFKDDLGDKYKKVEIQPAVLLTCDCRAYEEVEQLDERPYLKELIKKLDVELFSLSLNIQSIE